MGVRTPLNGKRRWVDPRAGHKVEFSIASDKEVVVLKGTCPQKEY